ncbi:MULTISPECIES: hypothetical protein [Streptomyces]|uniref:hypothetical protein n=1 Tax=Streptomyces TaxID=1883 RepID=UPI001E494553|nr:MULTISPECIES: hypothetical protein [Streptomyces]UFQ16882.1 hypothetical protein J2N69_18800 [Streptomyces huasconensis]WCL86485.1 hypothetical protein PPN52_18805 [Streptomyces sp. JCM 35825]
MNLSVLDTYFGWREPAHHTDCRRPAWTVDIREDEGFRPSYQGALSNHDCADEDCNHSSRYTRKTVRVVCRCCHAARVISGEAGSDFQTTTRTVGFGEEPRKVAGLLLWPGETWFDDEPHEWLVTGRDVERVERADLMGQISEGRGPRGGKQYSAVALPTPDGTHGFGKYRWARAEKGLKALAAAAKWIAGQNDQGAESK